MTVAISVKDLKTRRVQENSTQLKYEILDRFQFLVGKRGYGAVISITKSGNPVICSFGTIRIDEAVDGYNSLEVACLQSLSLKERVFILWRDFSDSVFMEEYLGSPIFSKSN